MASNDLIWRFTPSRTEPDVLEEIFVQRGALLTDLVERVSESALTGNKHQILLVGPRGIGKTHLIALVHHRVTEDSALADRVRIAWFLEDETITSFIQLLKRIYELLAEVYPSEFPQAWLEDLLDRPPAKILKALETVLVDKFQDKTLLLLIENLDLIFEGLGAAGQTQWRAFLQTHPFTSIVATSQRLFKSVKSRDRPFFGFFATSHLHPLRAPDAVELLRRIASHRKQPDLIEFLATAEGRSRVRALHHLAGGNHRIYVVLSGFITRESLDELVGPFEMMADELTPYYQERMRWLTPQQRQIVEYLCGREDTCTPKEIARHLLTTENTISSQLKKLLELGYLLRSPRGRESLYELAEPLMRLASEVKEKRTQPLRLLVNFLRVWYRPDTLPQLLAKACMPSLRAHIEAAISETLSTPDPRFKILEDEIQRARQAKSQEDLVRVLEDLAHTRGSAKDWFELAVSRFNLKDFEGAVDCLDKTAQAGPKNTSVWSFRGIALYKLGQNEAAIDSCKKALELDPRNSSAWFFKGLALVEFERHEAAIECYEKALEIDPRNPSYWKNKSDSLNELRRYEEAIECLDRSLEIDPRDTYVWNHKGHALRRFGRHEAARQCYERVLGLDSTDPDWVFSRCESRFALRLWETGFQLLKETLERSPKDTDHDVRAFIDLIQRQSDGREELRQHLATLITIYHKSGALAYLGDGLVRSLRQIDVNELNVETLNAWQESWQEVGSAYAELEIPLRIFRVGIAYLARGDAKCLLDLVKVERTVLRQALGLDAREGTQQSTNERGLGYSDRDGATSQDVTLLC